MTYERPPWPEWPQSVTCDVSDLIARLLKLGVEVKDVGTGTVNNDEEIAGIELPGFVATLPESDMPAFDLSVRYHPWPIHLANGEPRVQTASCARQLARPGEDIHGCGAAGTISVHIRQDRPARIPLCSRSWAADRALCFGVTRRRRGQRRRSS
jgi:hypothetical protein